MNPFIRFVIARFRTSPGVFHTQGTRQLPPVGPSEEHMTSSRVDILISLFKTLENRKIPREVSEPPSLVQQTEEGYQKEQAEWLALVKRKRDKKEGIM